MVGGTARDLGHDTIKAEPGEIEHIDEGVDDADRALLIDPVVQALGKQDRLAAIHVFDKASHRIPQTVAGNPTTDRLLTQPGSKYEVELSAVEVRFSTL